MTTQEEAAKPPVVTYVPSEPTGLCNSETTATAEVKDGLSLDISGGSADAILACGERSEQTYTRSKPVSVVLAAGNTGRVAKWTVTEKAKKYRFVMQTTVGNPDDNVPGNPIDKQPIWGKRFTSTGPTISVGTPCPTPTVTPTPTAPHLPLPLRLPKLATSLVLQVRPEMLRDSAVKTFPLRS